MLVRYIPPRCFLRLALFSPLSFMRYMDLRIISWLIYIMTVEIFILHFIITTTWKILFGCHRLGLRHETIPCAVGFTMFQCILQKAIHNTGNGFVSTAKYSNFFFGEYHDMVIQIIKTRNITAVYQITPYMESLTAFFLVLLCKSI